MTGYLILIAVIMILVFICFFLYQTARKRKEALEKAEADVAALNENNIRLAAILKEEEEIEDARKKKNHEIATADADNDELLNSVNGLLNDDSPD